MYHYMIYHYLLAFFSKQTIHLNERDSVSVNNDNSHQSLTIE